MSCQKPTCKDIDALQHWLDGPGMGDGFLNWPEDKIWRDHTDDLLTLLPASSQQDVFSNVLEGRVLSAYHAVWGHRRAVRQCLYPPYLRTPEANGVKRGRAMIMSTVPCEHTAGNVWMV